MKTEIETTEGVMLSLEEYNRLVEAAQSPVTQEPVQWPQKVIGIGADYASNVLGHSDWKLVPLEPTEAMYKAADSREWDGRTSVRQKGVYQAMVAASPDIPASPLSAIAVERAAGEEIAAEVTRAIRAIRQDVRPYMRHLEDCELVIFRSGHFEGAKCPPCSCGLEKVLWDIPAEIETGRTK